MVRQKKKPLPITQLQTNASEFMKPRAFAVPDFKHSSDICLMHSYLTVPQEISRIVKSRNRFKFIVRPAAGSMLARSIPFKSQQGYMENKWGQNIAKKVSVYLG